MPPKPKFTKEEIIAAALELVSQNGIEALTSRDLGKKLGSSARPIFTVFKGMEEVQQEVKRAAMARFDRFAEKAVDYTPAFKQFGMQMVLFANEEPKLFQLLFMTENREAKSFDQVLFDLGTTGQLCIDVIMNDYGLNRPNAILLFRHLWIHTFGIGALCASGTCRFSEAEVNEMLGQDFMAMLMLIKSGNFKNTTVKPKLKPKE